MEKYFQESILLCFLKISISLKKLYYSLFVNNFQYKLVTCMQINRLVSIRYDFLLKGVS